MIVVPSFRNTLLANALLASSAAGRVPERPCLTPTFVCRVGLVPHASGTTQSVHLLREDF
jgi:hypothetical protein